MKPQRARMGVAIAALCALTGSAAASTTEAATLATPMAFGAAQSSYPGATHAQAVQNLEGTIGRSLAYVRVYRLWDSPFPDANINWMRSTGHSLFLSIRAKRVNGTSIPWVDIANAQPGQPLYSDMVRWATAIKEYPTPVFLAFNHEPETTSSQPSGTAADFVAAWQKFVTVMRLEGVTNAHLAWTMAVRSFSLPPTDRRYAPKFYPGDEWVDVIAVDAYNMYCLRKDGKYQRPWRSLGEVLAPFMQFVQSHPTPDLALAEFGTPEDVNAPGRKAEWIAAAQQLFKQPEYARFVAISYWNQKSSNFANCDFRVDTSSSSLDAFKTMVNDPFYGGQVR